MTTELHDDQAAERSTPPPPTARRRAGTVGASPAARRAASQASSSTATRSRTSPGAGEAGAAPAASSSTATATAEVAGRGAPAASARPLDRGPIRGGRPARLPWVLAIVGLVGTLGFGLAWNSGRGGAGGGSAAASAAERSAAVKVAAERFATALTNFDGSSIDHDVSRIVALSSGQFRSQVGQFFSAKTRAALKEAQASSRGEINSAYVESVTGDRAAVFVVVDQTIANNKSPQPQADTVRMELSLSRAAGAWSVVQVDVLQAPGDRGSLPGSRPSSGAGASSSPSGAGH